MDLKEKCKKIGGKFTAEGCVIPKDVFDDLSLNERYLLHGFVTVHTWYGRKGFENLIIDTNKEGYEKIKKDPLQDFIKFGVESVDYAEFFPVKNTELIKTEELPRIEAGKYDLTEEDEKYLSESIPTIIRY